MNGLYVLFNRISNWGEDKIISTSPEEKMGYHHVIRIFSFSFAFGLLTPTPLLWKGSLNVGKAVKRT